MSLWAMAFIALGLLCIALALWFVSKAARVTTDPQWYVDDIEGSERPPRARKRRRDSSGYSTPVVVVDSSPSDCGGGDAGGACD